MNMLQRPAVQRGTATLTILTAFLATLAACGGGGGGGSSPIPELRLLSFTQPPTDGTAGQPIAPAVTVSLLRDGAVDALAAETVTIALASGNGSLTGTVSSQAVNGVAVFVDLAVSEPGANVTLAASAAGYGTVISDPFTVSAIPVEPPPRLDSLSLAATTVAVRETTELTYMASGAVDQVTLEPGGIDVTGAAATTFTPFALPPGTSIGLATTATVKVRASRAADTREYLDTSRLQAIGDAGAVLEVTDVAIAPDGSYTLIGNFEGTVRFGVGTTAETQLTSGSETDCFVARYAAGGTLAWVKWITGTPGLSGTRDLRSVVELVGGQIAVLGSYTGPQVRIDPTGSNLDVFGPGSAFVAVFATDGSALRAYQPLTSLFDRTVDIGFSAAPTAAGGVVYAGRDERFGAVEFMIRADFADGSKQFITDVRGDGADECTAVATGTGQGIAFAGTFEQDIAFYEGGSNYTGGSMVAGSAKVSDGGADVLVGVLETTGELRWAAQIGGAGDDGAFGVDIFADGGVVVSGSFVGSARVRDASTETTLTATGGVDDFDVFVARFDANGRLMWVRTGGGASVLQDGSPGDESRAIEALPDGSCLVTGYFTGAATFGAGSSNAVQLTAAGGADDVDAFLVRYLADGQLVYATRAGSAEIDEGASVTAKPDGTVLWGGFVGGSANVTTTSGPTELVVTGTQDGFLVELAPRNYGFASITATGFDSATRWADATASLNDSDRALDVAALPDGGALVVGWFQGTQVFNAGTAEQITLTSAGGRDAFYARQRSDGTTAWARSIGGSGLEMAMGVAVDASGAIAVSGVFMGGLPIPAEGGTDVFVMEVDPRDGSPKAIQATGGSFDDGGIRQAAPVDIDDGDVAITYDPTGAGADRRIWFASTADRLSSIYSRIYRDGTLGPRTLISSSSAVSGLDIWVQSFEPQAASIVPATEVLLGTGTGQEDRGRAIEIAPDGAIYVGGTLQRLYNVTFLGLGTTQVTIPNVVGGGIDGFIVRAKPGEASIARPYSTQGDDRITSIVYLPSDEVAYAGRGQDGNGKLRGVISYLSPQTLSPTQLAVFYGAGPVLDMVVQTDRTVALVGYVSDTASLNPFNPNGSGAETAYLTTYTPNTPAAPVRFFGGMGRDRATGVARLADGSLSVCGYCFDDTFNASGYPGYNPICVFGFDTPAELRLDQPDYGPVTRSDAIVGRFLTP